MANAEPTVVTATLHRIAAVRNPDNLGGYSAKRVTLTLRAESVQQLRMMANIAAVDGWINGKS